MNIRLILSALLFVTSMVGCNHKKSDSAAQTSETANPPKEKNIFAASIDKAKAVSAVSDRRNDELERQKNEMSEKGE